MEGKVIEYSQKFLKALSRMPKNIAEYAQEKERIFHANPFDPRLDTHKLHGKDKDVWSFSITHSYRIKFIFLAKGGVLFLEIDTHDIYK